MDILLTKLFEIKRWESAIETAVEKGIDKNLLRRLCSPEERSKLYVAIRDDNFEIAPPRTAQIPKDNGDFRTVYINEDVDRIILSLINDMFFEMFPEMVHPRCMSYQKGIGCGKVVLEASRLATTTKGFKSDLSKYFDSVPIRYIDKIFDRIESKVGKSKVIEVCRKYYHCDSYYEKHELKEKYQSLKQGCALASFLADAILYDIDEALTSFGEFYVRYSDDILYLGRHYKSAMKKLSTMLNEMELTLNPKKVEYLDGSRWFKFLGFSIRGSSISLSKSRLKSFQKDIAQLTFKNRKRSFTKALNNVNNYLYKGKYPWATSVLSIINVESDINELNKYILDALRATQTHRGKIGGLGYAAVGNNGVIIRGIGKNVTSNRERTSSEIDGYKSLMCIKNVLATNREAYETVVASL